MSSPLKIVLHFQKKLIKDTIILPREEITGFRQNIADRVYTLKM